MRTSIVVVPRERFTSLPVSLRSLFATIPGEVPVVVVEGGTPPAGLRHARARARRDGRPLRRRPSSRTGHGTFDPIDLRYHLFRWSDRFVVESLDRGMFRYSWAAKHRARAAETTYPRMRRILGKERFRRWVVARLERRVVGEQLRARGERTPALPRALPRDEVDRVLASLMDASGAPVSAH